MNTQLCTPRELFWFKYLNNNQTFIWSLLFTNEYENKLVIASTDM